MKRVAGPTSRPTWQSIRPDIPPNLALHAVDPARHPAQLDAACSRSGPLLPRIPTTRARRCTTDPKWSALRARSIGHE